ncbi:hypothetical protein, conserved [Trypanosoma brucei brucei TREU927]|uniref:Uncharacterized protein n=1 Tax=Trypanosoma brucei brucei (strain 927/4 GUTat10.1) TaxID=185431 RepID=Q4GYI3_TRYB2|nr:hypothetical protein, conserved [Trypanosoma brucei brucei TREU927]CAJ16601.1 hypothetical protein, conserved [Trypanosoma brucei brucei TREU927]
MATPRQGPTRPPSAVAGMTEDEIAAGENAGKSMTCQGGLYATSERCRELLDDVANKERALSQLRCVLEEMAGAYEQLQRHSQRIETELETLTARYNVQQEELIAAKSKVSMQESKLQQADEDYQRRTQQLRWELKSAREERDEVTADRESLWTQIRSLRADVEEHRRVQQAAEAAWESKLADARKEATEKAHAVLREREEILSIREAELQRALSKLEGRFDETAAETRRLELLNESLRDRVGEMQECVQREAEMRHRLEAARGTQQQENKLLSECMELERRGRREQQKAIEGGYEAQLREMKRSYELLERERRRQEEESCRALRESRLATQLARDEWLAQQQHLELTISGLRGEVDRGRLRFDQVDELKQRAESELLRAQRELQFVQQRETTLQETVETLQGTVARHRATEVRLEGEIQRLLAVVAEREREVERWKCAAERLEWKRYVGAEEVPSLSSHGTCHFHQQCGHQDGRDVGGMCGPTTELPFSPESAVPAQPTVVGSLAPACSGPSTPSRPLPSFLTPCLRQYKRCQQPYHSQHIESIDRTPNCLLNDVSRFDCTQSSEEVQAELLRSIVQDVLWEHLQPGDGVSINLMGANGHPYSSASPTGARVGGQGVPHISPWHHESRRGPPVPTRPMGEQRKSVKASQERSQTAHDATRAQGNSSPLRNPLVELPNACATPLQGPMPRDCTIQLNIRDRSGGAEHHRCGSLSTSSAIAGSAVAASETAVSPKATPTPPFVAVTSTPNSSTLCSGAFLASTPNNLSVGSSATSHRRRSTLSTHFCNKEKSKRRSNVQGYFSKQRRQPPHDVVPAPVSYEGVNELGAGYGFESNPNNSNQRFSKQGRDSRSGRSPSEGSVKRLPSSASDIRCTSNVLSIGSDVTSSTCVSATPPAPLLQLTALQERFATMSIL